MALSLGQPALDPIDLVHLEHIVIVLLLLPLELSHLHNIIAHLCCGWVQEGGVFSAERTRQAELIHYIELLSALVLLLER